MKDVIKILITASIANLLTAILYFNAASQPGGSGATMVFTIIEMPIVWVICLIITIVFTIRDRKSLFKKAILKWTILILLFCTPIPFSVVFIILNYSNTYLASTGYNPRNGVTIKDEEWCYTSNNKLAIHKYFKLESENYSAVDDSLFKKDSVWTYFNSKGDTIKTEQYQNGKLIVTLKK